MCALSIFSKLLLGPILIWAAKWNTFFFFFFFTEKWQAEENSLHAAHASVLHLRRKNIIARLGAWRFIAKTTAAVRIMARAPPASCSFKMRTGARWRLGVVCVVGGNWNRCGQMHALIKCGTGRPSLCIILIDRLIDTFYLSTLFSVICQSTNKDLIGQSHWLAKVQH